MRTRVRLTRGRGGDAPVRGKVHADDLVLEGILGVHLGAPLGDERVAEERGRPRSHERSMGEKSWVTIESSESLVWRRGRAAVCGERVEGRAGDSPGECGERDGRAGGPSGFGGTVGWRVCRAAGSDVVSVIFFCFGFVTVGKMRCGSGRPPSQRTQQRWEARAPSRAPRRGARLRLSPREHMHLIPSPSRPPRPRASHPRRLNPPRRRHRRRTRDGPRSPRDMPESSIASTRSRRGRFQHPRVTLESPLPTPAATTRATPRGTS